MAQPMFVEIKGKTQGPFKGSGKGGRSPVVSFEYAIASQHDPGSGLPTGRREHDPVVFQKEWDAASPMLLQALVTNETLTTVTFEFLQTSVVGKEEVEVTVTLTNASVASFRESVQVGAQGGPVVDPRRLDQVALTYQKIEVANVPGGTQVSDDWEAPE